MGLGVKSYVGKFIKAHRILHGSKQPRLENI